MGMDIDGWMMGVHACISINNTHTSQWKSANRFSTSKYSRFSPKMVYAMSLGPLRRSTPNVRAAV